tara:strand:- start:171 stop:749 length:579 start_codon:yes stop_codon:yes gene_type:complete
MKNKIGNAIQQRKTANDKIYTPKTVALKMIDMCDLKEDDTVLDPSYGGGVFYDNLPEYVNKEWCEIEKGKDFFEYDKKVDCIIGNPPYSLWNKWLEHTMKLTDKFCYIFGILNLTDKRVRKIIDNGYGITKMHLLYVDWWFGPSYLVVFQKNKPSIMSVEPNRVLCDICNRRCKRGLNGNNPNECTNHINTV